MQINKQLVAIIILASLLFSAVGAALFFFKKNQQTLKDKNELVTVYIAKEDIPRDTLLSIENLSQTKIAKEFILNEPMLKEEIIGKYTNEKIYKHEIFLKQKLDTQIKKEEKKVLDFEKSSYNLKFELFKNPNYSIKQGEYINIVSVFPKGEANNKGLYLDYEVDYVAQSIKVLGFIRDGRQESNTITKQTVKKIENKKTIEVIEEVKSDEIILDIDLDVLLELIKNYNKGTQLWMVKTKYQEIKKEDNLDILKALIPSKKIQNKKVSDIQEISFAKYQYKMYAPKKTTRTQTAMIDYANDKNKEKTKTKNIDIVVDANKMCSQINDKFLVGMANSFYIRSSASKSSVEKTILNKNIIIPFISKVSDWYKTCDEKFIHQSVVKEVDASFVKNKLDKYE